MAVRKVQIRLNDKRKIDAEIMAHLEDMGTYSGEERKMLIAGYLSLYGQGSNQWQPPAKQVSKPEPENKGKQTPKPMIDEQIKIPSGMMAGG